MQSYLNEPYPLTGGPRWLRDIAYVLWITDIVLTGSFLMLLLLRWMMYPWTLRKNLLEFPGNSFLGAIPISINTIIIGIIGFYNHSPSARWVAFGVWWINLVLTLFVGVVLFVLDTTYIAPKTVTLDKIAGVWVMMTVPLFTLAGAGANLSNYLTHQSTKAAVAVTVISWLVWGWAILLLTLILAIYLWRLVSHKLPGPMLLATSFLPVAALSQGGYAVWELSIFLGGLIRSGFGPTQVVTPPLADMIRSATAESVHWAGILIMLAMLGQASVWLVHGTASMLYQRPKNFHVGWWSLVFPWASYANAWAAISRDLRNNGMRGWADTQIVISTILWLFCAGMTVWFGFIKGDMFSSPGLDEWRPEKRKEAEEQERQQQKNEEQEEKDNQREEWEKQVRKSDERARARESEDMQARRAERGMQESDHESYMTYDLRRRPSSEFRTVDGPHHRDEEMGLNGLGSLNGNGRV